MAADVGKPRWDWQAVETDKAIKDAVRELAAGAIDAAYRIAQKQDRQTRLADIRQDVLAKLTTATEGGGAQFNSEHVRNVLDSLEKDVVRGRIIACERRIDGRDTRSVRPITVRVGVLPRTHGSALFTRGETQALVVSTLGPARDAQMIDAIEGEYRGPFMFNYNFPPSRVRETGMVGSPKRREIGHGRLAKRGVAAVMPDM